MRSMKERDTVQQMQNLLKRLHSTSEIARACPMMSFHLWTLCLDNWMKKTKTTKKMPGECCSADGSLAKPFSVLDILSDSKG